MSNNPQTENRFTPSAQMVSTGKPTEASPVRYVVLREGHRVSDREYETPTDSKCIEEVRFWTRIAKNHSYGEKVEAVKYDSKIHRVW